MAREFEMKVGELKAHLKNVDDDCPVEFLLSDLDGSKQFCNGFIKYRQRPKYPGGGSIVFHINQRKRFIDKK